MSAETSAETESDRTTEGPTASASDLDVAALTRYLDGRLPGFDAAEPLQVDLLAGGRSNLTFRIRQSGGDWALRRPPLGHVMASAHDMGREYRVQSGLNMVDFPAPTMRLLCTDHEVLGADFYVMDFVTGRVLSTAEDTAALTPEQRRTLSAHHLDTLTQLHGLDLTAAGLDQLGKPTGYVRRQIRRWTGQWETTKTRELPALGELAGWLTDRGPKVPDLGATLVHGDFRMDNMVVDPATYRPIAVLDWEMSTLGDPIADLAVVLVYWTEPGDRLRRDLPVSPDVTTAPGFFTRDEVAEYYARVTGRDLSQLDFHVALACFKLAVIMESIRYRILAGMQRGISASDADEMGRATEALIEIGLRATRIGGVAALGS
ncbi:phosphotransferase family protein [Nakamurella leprariae]|uniref:Phosphotransferase family protein n=1 Tax=Nakamurella leprariae TaxID=2803911 RepID=A0A938YAS2_9ACTN|nr:phosphotransferase family protein [Nakamurella leprariae]MBM9469050.1 phosphotransferase family protein [Nakamurella leprariae]